MRSFRFAACMSVLLMSALVIAEQAPKSGHRHGKQIPIERTAYVRPVAPAEQPPANGVVIYNGNQKQTRIFNALTDPSAPVQNLSPAVVAIVTAESKSQSARPVVVGITSGAPGIQPVVVSIASSGSSAQPVVVGVASSGFQTTGAVEPATIGVSPRPAKRPPYRPACLDLQ